MGCDEKHQRMFRISIEYYKYINLKMLKNTELLEIIFTLLSFKQGFQLGLGEKRKPASRHQRWRVNFSVRFLGVTHL